MNIEEAKNSIGKQVMSHDNEDSFKMLSSLSEAHGPYKVLSVTKGGKVELERKEEYVKNSRFVAPRHLRKLTEYH